MNLERRLRALEAKMNAGEEKVLLYFEDGSTRELFARRGFLMRLLGDVVKEADPDLAVERDLIRRSVGSIDPDGAHMVDLIRALLNGPKGEDGMSEPLEEQTQSAEVAISSGAGEAGPGSEAVSNPDWRRALTTADG